MSTYEKEHVDQLSQEAVVLFQIFGQAFQVICSRQGGVSSLLYKPNSRRTKQKAEKGKRRVTKGVRYRIVAMLSNCFITTRCGQAPKRAGAYRKPPTALAAILQPEGKPPSGTETPEHQETPYSNRSILQIRHTKIDWANAFAHQQHIKWAHLKFAENFDDGLYSLL